MNWLFRMWMLVIGIPVGVLLFRFGDRLERRYKGKSDTVRGLLLGLPLVAFATLVVLTDIFL